MGVGEGVGMGGVGVCASVHTHIVVYAHVCACVCVNVCIGDTHLWIKGYFNQTPMDILAKPLTIPTTFMLYYVPQLWICHFGCE